MKNKELELYIHIPFCIKKCNYCDFLSAPGKDEARKLYLETLVKDMKQKSLLYEDYMVTSIFIGGGTPSVLEAEEIKSLMTALYESFQINDLAEITIEANPGTLTYEKLMTYKTCNINRLSLGLQSANNRELKLLGRIHTYEDFKESFDLARKCGFSNINVDIMSALPEQTTATWKGTLENVIQLDPEHVSAYSLIIEENTPFYETYIEDNKQRERGNSPQILPREETEREMYYLTQELLTAEGYQRYEISNYAKQGRECQHNIGYWTGKEYLGLGLGAASYIAGRRFKNISDLQLYCKENFYPEEEIVLSPKEQMEEFMFLGLRMIRGVSKSRFYRLFQKSMDRVYNQEIESLKKEGLLFIRGDFVGLTTKGLDVSNYVLAQFLLE